MGGFSLAAFLPDWSPDDVNLQSRFPLGSSAFRWTPARPVEQSDRGETASREPIMLNRNQIIEFVGKVEVKTSFSVFDQRVVR